MILRSLPAVWLCLCLSSIAGSVLAQETLEVQVIAGQKMPGNFGELPRWQLGLELSRPVVQQFDKLSNWDNVLPLEVLGQYHFGASAVYGQLYSGYFMGNKRYQNGTQLQQTGFYLKPGLLYVVENYLSRHTLTLEANLIFSLGKVKGENTFYGPVFGDYEVQHSVSVKASGAEIGIGAEVVRFGDYKLRVLARLAMVGENAEGGVFYIPGSGNVTNNILPISGGLNLYLMRAGKP